MWIELFVNYETIFTLRTISFLTSIVLIEIIIVSEPISTWRRFAEHKIDIPKA